MLLYIFVVALPLLLVQGRWVKEMENQALFQGDIILTPDQLNAAKNGNLGFATTKANHWPTTIYYDWAPELANSRAILAAIADYEKYTCLRFIKRTNQKDYMYFYVGGGCSSGVGFFGGKQTISIGRGCASKGVVIHEIGHRLGIYHEQSRPDRDDYITIKFENIRSPMEYNFNKQRASNIDSLGTKYDYLSIMHYADWSFSKNGKPTIITKDPSMQKKIGNRAGLSEIDKIQVNKLYKCATVPTGTPTQPPTQLPANSFMLQHSGGRCLDIDAQDNLVFKSSCTTRFIIKNGNLIVAASGKCIKPQGNNDNSIVKVNSDCDSSFSISDMSNGYFALKNGNTGKCLHPYKGASRPVENCKVVIYSGCDGLRLKFRLKKY